MKNAKQIEIMAHLVAGYPDTGASLRLAETFAASGANILEIQMPFSEPVADGPTIVEACHVALKNGFRSKEIFAFCHKVSKFGVPIVIMSYSNPIMSIGIDSFCRQAVAAGVSGLIVPDLPFDSKEGEELLACSKKYGLNLIQVVSPSMSGDRLKRSIACSQGMIYCTTKRGTTGGQTSISADLKKVIEAIRKQSDIKIALGFGISSRKDVEAVAGLADIAVVGSALLRAFSSGGGEDAAAKLLKSMKPPLDR
ncbi:MAG: Tryptophan synthase alpha chain [Candidatus Taylorbacteria bacterium]|nr:Tryptophan synthase alpha chain [Candidatus Taylorbacteria bacterium]